MRHLKQEKGLSIVTSQILPITVDEFYESFLAKNAMFGFNTLDIKMNRKESNYESDWKNDGTRLLKSVVPLSGVPFISETRHHKLLQIKERNKKKIFL